MRARCEASLREAIRFHLGGLREDGLPAATTPAAVLEA